MARLTAKGGLELAVNEEFESFPFCLPVYLMGIWRVDQAQRYGVYQKEEAFCEIDYLSSL